MNINYSNMTESFLAHYGTKITLNPFIAENDLSAYQNKTYLLYVRVPLAVSDL